MALPVINALHYKLKLPVSKEEVSYRSYLVKEQKIILQASEYGGEKQLLDAMDQILKNVTSESVDIDSKNIADIEYLMLNVRGKSVGETIDLKYKCSNTVKKKQYDPKEILPVPLTDENGEEIFKEDECGGSVEGTIDIRDVKVEQTEDRDGKIELSESVGIVLKDLTYGENRKIEFNEDAKSDVQRLENNLKVLIKHIQLVYEGDKVYTDEDFTEQEMLDFLDQLHNDDIDRIQKYIESAPRLTHTVSLTCPKCGHTEELTFNGLNDFLL